MKELDFDELDRAVNAIIDQRQAKDSKASAATAQTTKTSVDEDEAPITAPTSGYVGTNLSPSSYTSTQGDDDDEESSSPLFDEDVAEPDSAKETQARVEEDSSPDASTKRKPRRFMDVKHAAPARGMKVIQPLSAGELAKQGIGPSVEKPEPTLEYSVTSKPFFDIKPGRPKKASDVTFLIDREESTSELIAAEDKSPETSKDTDKSSRPSEKPVVSDLFDIDSVKKDRSEAPKDDDPVDEEIDVDDFSDTLESLEVKALDHPTPSPLNQPATEVSADAMDDKPLIDTSAEPSPTDVSSPDSSDQSLTAELPSIPPSDETPVALDAMQQSPASTSPLMPDTPDTTTPVEPVATDEPPTPDLQVAAPSAVNPMTSPFLPDAKVEKRPLGSPISVGEPDDKQSAESVDVQQDSIEEAPKETSIAATAETETPPIKTEETVSSTDASFDNKLETYDDTLPAEYQSSLLKLESDSTGSDMIDEPDEDVADVADDTADDVVAADKEEPVSKPEPKQPEKSQSVVSTPQEKPKTELAAAIGSQQIPRQYSETKTEEAEIKPIYETESYRQPMATAKKQKSGWWVVVIVFLVIALGGGGGALLYLMQTGAL